MLFGIKKAASIINSKNAIVWLRVFSSFAWLDSAFIGKDAKLAPAFLHGGELATRIHTTFLHTALDLRIAQVLAWYVLPHANFFALLIAGADVVAGLSLALGLFVRLGAAIAIMRALVNIAVVGGAGPDTVGYNGMLIVAGGICIATAAGRKYGLDALLINRFPSNRMLRIVA
jgi:uncharacterized membrane protein YphA (DoxX/SURF4 family)